MCRSRRVRTWYSSTRGGPPDRHSQVFGLQATTPIPCLPGVPTDFNGNSRDGELSEERFDVTGMASVS